MTLATLKILMLLAFLGLIGLGLSALMVIRAQNRMDKIKQRVKAATEPHLRMPKVEAVRAFRAKAIDRPNTPYGKAARIFGYNTSRPDQYPVKWYVVLCLVLIVARVLSGVLVALIGQVMWLSLPVIWVMGCRTVFSMMVMRRRARLYGQFPDCLAMIVRSVRAGVPLTEAIRIVAKESIEPSATEFGRVAGDLAIGVSVADALKSLAERAEITEFRFFATALILQSQTGGRLGETLDNLAQIVRKRMAMKSRGHALAAEAKMTAMILGGLPVLAAGGLYLLNPDYVDVLFVDPTGQLILMAALSSLGTGAFIMKAIISKSLA
jgi:tight adherence protein B